MPLSFIARNIQVYAIADRGAGILACRPAFQLVEPPEKAAAATIGCPTSAQTSHGIIQVAKIKRYWALPPVQILLNPSSLRESSRRHSTGIHPAESRPVRGSRTWRIRCRWRHRFPRGQTEGNPHPGPSRYRPPRGSSRRRPATRRSPCIPR